MALYLSELTNDALCKDPLLQPDHLVGWQHQQATLNFFKRAVEVRSFLEALGDCLRVAVALAKLDFRLGNVREQVLVVLLIREGIRFPASNIVENQLIPESSSEKGERSVDQATCLFSRGGRSNWEQKRVWETKYAMFQDEARQMNERERT